MILLLYVDDMIVANLDMDKIKSLKQQLSKEFDMKDLIPTKKILWLQIMRHKQEACYILGRLHKPCFTKIQHA